MPYSIHLPFKYALEDIMLLYGTKNLEITIMV